MTTTDVTVIGLGAMGSALARALIAGGHRVTVWNRSAAKADALVRAGAVLEPTVERALQASEVIVVCVKDYPATHALLEGSALTKKVVVQLSTGTPSEARAVAEVLRAQGAEYLDGAILNVPSQVSKPESGILVSGSRSAFERCRTLLDAMAGSVTYLGDRVGAAAACDFAILSVLFSALLGLYHGTRVVESEGLRPDLLGDMLLGAAPALGQMLQTDARTIQSGNYGFPEASLEICWHALAVIARQAKEAGLEATIPTFLASQFERGMAAGLGSESPAALYKLLRAGTA